MSEFSEQLAKMSPEEMSNALGVIVMNAFKIRYQKPGQKALEEIYKVFKNPADKIKSVLKEQYYETVR